MVQAIRYYGIAELFNTIGDEELRIHFLEMEEQIKKKEPGNRVGNSFYNDLMTFADHCWLLYTWQSEDSAFAFIFPESIRAPEELIMFDKI